MSFTTTSDKFDDELRDAVRQEVYDRYYNVFGHLLPEERYLELIESDVDLLVAERKERVRNVLCNETSLAVEPGTPQVPDIPDYDLFGDLECGKGYESGTEKSEKAEAEKNEWDLPTTALETIPESER